MYQLTRKPRAYGESTGEGNLLGAPLCLLLQPCVQALTLGYDAQDPVRGY